MASVGALDCLVQALCLFMHVSLLIRDVISLASVNCTEQLKVSETALF